MTSVIVTTRSPLQGSISSAGGQLWPLSAREEVLLGTSNRDSYFGSSISSSMVAKRESRLEGDVSASYVVLDDATADILSSI